MEKIIVEMEKIMSDSAFPSWLSELLVQGKSVNKKDKEELKF